MPYITQPRRKDVDPIVDMMSKVAVDADGDLNYILFKYCKYHIPQSYNKIKNYIAELEEAANEIRRKILSPYEDQKIIDNGEI